MTKTFEFDHNGKTYKFPTFEEIPFGALRAAKKESNDADKAVAIIEHVFGEDSKEIGILDSMNISEFKAFMEAWTGGASLGE